MNEECYQRNREIAHVLNANHAPLAIVLDFADMLEERGEIAMPRRTFVAMATGQIQADTAHMIRKLNRALEIDPL